MSLAINTACRREVAKLRNSQAVPAPSSGGDRRADRRSFERGVSVAGIAAREADGGARREMAPQRLEKIESAPGNGMGSEASNVQNLVHGRAADRARLRLTSRK